MAKLGAYYGLCPLIDHRSLLGISPAEESGIVLVTLGKNVAIKYRLSDQKQLRSWRTKDKFTAPIIYDTKHSYYVGVFNETFLRLWNSNKEDGDDEFLDKLKKKHKFKQQIYTIFLNAGNSFIVFKDGNIKLLDDALDNRKNLDLYPILLPKESILDIVYTSIGDILYIGLLVVADKNDDGNLSYSLLWTRFDVSEKSSESYTRINLTRSNLQLAGYCLHVDQFSYVSLLNLWSDGRLYSTFLSETDDENASELITILETISCNHEFVSMTPLDQNYIAMYGNNKDEEGALLFIYNIQFRIIQSRQSFKMFNNGAKMYSIEENLFLPVGQNLAVIRYHLDTEQVMSLVGSHLQQQRADDDDPDVVIVNKMIETSWGYSLTSNSNHKKVRKSLEISKDFIEQGYPESLIIDDLFLAKLTKSNCKNLKKYLNYLVDLPEIILVKILKFVLNLKQQQILDLVLTKNFTDVLLVPQLKSHFNIDDIIALLEYFCFLLGDEGHYLPEMDSIKTKEKLLNWSCCLLDAKYQQLLICSREEPRIRELIKMLLILIEQDLSYMGDLRDTFCRLNEIAMKKTPSKKQPQRKSYSIEEVEWY